MNSKLEKASRNYIETHPVESKVSALKVQDDIFHSELNAGHTNITHTLHIPKYFTQEDKRNFEKIVDTMMPIFYQTIDAYKKDPEVRSLFPFDERLEQIILNEPDHVHPIPICRLDIFYDEQSGDFKFCEFNTDGTSAMNENFRLTQFLAENNVYNALKPEAESCELMESWIDALLDNTTEENPNIAIVDFLDRAYLSEFYEFERRMKERGLNVEVTDIRDFTFDGKNLISTKSGRKIDLVYRRAVTADMVERKDQVEPFLQALEHRAFVCAGPLSTQIIHHKAIVEALNDEHLTKYFTKDQVEFLRRHLPMTYRLTPETAALARKNKDFWIIKPEDSYASHGVYCGQDLKQEQWEKVLGEHADQSYQLQEYVTPYRSLNIDLLEKDGFKEYTNMTGLYVYNGKFAGVYSRMSDGAVISTQYNEKAVPTLFTKE